jgi:hypothetical protein
MKYGPYNRTNRTVFHNVIYSKIRPIIFLSTQTKNEIKVIKALFPLVSRDFKGATFDIFPDYQPCQSLNSTDVSWATCPHVQTLWDTCPCKNRYFLQVRDDVISSQSVHSAG